MLVPKDIPLTAVKIRGSHISMLKSLNADRADSARLAPPKAHQPNPFPCFIRAASILGQLLTTT